MVPIFQARSEEVGEALLEHVITKHCIPDYIIMDQDSAFMSLLMTYLFHRLNIKIKTIAPYNRQPLQAELNTETNPDVKISRNFKEYYDLLNKRIKYLQDILFNFKSWRLAMINKSRENFQYTGGDLVYIISPLTSQLRTNSRENISEIYRPCGNL